MYAHVGVLDLIIPFGVYVTFVASFAHGLLCGTDLAYPVTAALTWGTVLVLGLFGLRRLGHALRRTIGADAIRARDQRRAA